MHKLLTLITVISLISGFSLFAQTEKSVTPLPAEVRSAQAGVTRAVVVGISDYQEPQIPDLRFAHRDAEVFANWLHSAAGGNVPTDNIRLLLNEQATGGQFTAAIGWLIEQTREGDRVVIYFSGHGDMEAKILGQLGFLLLWDSPAHAYLAGALPVDILKNVVTTLSVENKAKVLVVADACRAGKLAGNNVIGAQLTNANLARQFAHEQKILSCQADEYSIEGEQWGGGRGAFSWYLVNGLYGQADRNGDNRITLSEIERFVQDRVAPDVKPLSQIPVTVGDKTEVMATLDGAALSSLKKGEQLSTANFSGVEQRGLVQDVLAKADGAMAGLFQAFQNALLDKRFLEPAGNCAEDYYTRLIREASIKPLHNYLRRNYAAALQDAAQQVLNEWLKTKSDETILADASYKTIHLPEKVFTAKIRSFPRCLDRAAELLGKEHYMYATLQARKYFFEGYLLANSNRNPDAALGERALSLFRQSLHWQPQQPQAYWQMSWVFGYNLPQADSMEYYARRATEMSPAWVLPANQAAFLLAHQYRQFDRAKLYLEQASRIDSNSALVRDAWGTYFYLQKAYSKAEQQYLKSIALDSMTAHTWNNLGTMYLQNQQYAKAELALKKAISLDSTSAIIRSNLGNAHSRARHYAEAEQQYKKAIQLDSTFAQAYSHLGNIYIDARRYAEAQQQQQKAIQLDSTFANAYINLANIYQLTGRYAEAEQQYKKAIQLDSTLVLAYTNLGSAYLATGRYAEAEQQYKKAIRLDSTDANAYTSLGWAYSVTDRYAEAEPVLKKAIQLDSTYWAPYNNLGAVCIATNRYGEAEQHFKKVLQLNPGSSGTYYNLAYLYCLQNELDKAYEMLEQAIRNGENDYDGLQEDPDFAPLRARDLGTSWKALMKKYFPDRLKD